jgi:hypothetical protein
LVSNSKALTIPSDLPISIAMGAFVRHCPTKSPTKTQELIVKKSLDA